jgi:acetolactate synthase small subunit
MKREISIEVSTGTRNATLTKVVSAIEDRQLPIEMLTWSEVLGTNEARIWVVIEAEDAAFDGLVNQLCVTSGVSLIASRGPGQTLIKRLRKNRPQMSAARE